MALLPPPDIGAAYVDEANRPSKDFYNWIKSLYDFTRGVTGGGGGGGGSIRTQRYIAVGPVIIASGDDILNCNFSVPISIGLPIYSTRAGRPLTFKDMGGVAATNNITIVPSGGDLIDGRSSFVLNANRQAITVTPFNDTVNVGWFIA